ncbi:MAG: hypothetical protein HY741_07295 [Chloroflexi bacterium]|nr:hypothetical protein [Chloroflexota bacterium]
MKRTLFRFFLPILSSLAIFFLIACEADPATFTAPVPTIPPTIGSTATNAPTRTPRATQAALPSPTKLTPTVAPTPTVRRRGGSLIVAGVGEPSREIAALPQFVASALYDSLLRVNPQDGSLLPGLATSWTVSDDAKTVTFVLRQGVKWHDGLPLTAGDVVFTLKTLSDAKIRVTPAADFGSLADVTAPDAQTVRLTFREPYCAALTYIGNIKILPEHVLKNKPLNDVAPADLIGTGPLILKAWQDDALTFKANAAYWNGAPWVTDWTYRAYPAYPDERAARDAVRQGDADVVVTQDVMDGTQNSAYTTNEFYALAINTKRAPFDDVRVRQAVAVALDRAQFTTTLRGTTLETSMLPSFWANANPKPQSFDVARARQLLSDAGWRDADGDGIVEKAGKPLEVTLWAQADDATFETAAQIARAQLEAIGIRAVLKLPERYLYLTRVFLQEYDLALAHFNIPLDPDQHYFWSTQSDEPGYGLNVTGYANAQVDQALDTGNAVARCEPTARKQIYALMFQRLATDAPMVFLFAPTRNVNARAQVQGIAPSSFAGAFWNLNAWEVAP